MNLPLVSIITPTYNHEKYIADCIQSVIAQSFSSWEMIIIDDGSTDLTFQIASKFALSDSRIRVFTQKNKGIFQLSETYNFGLNQSKGKYIAVLEGDDVWFPEKLTLQVNSLESNPDAVLSWGKAYASSFDLQKDNHLLPIIPFDETVFFNNPVKSALKVLIFTNHIPALTVFIRKSSLIQIGGFQQMFGLPLVDIPTWQKLSTLGPFTYINQALGRWRITSTQATKTFNIEMINGILQLSLQLYNENADFLNKLNISEKIINKHFHSRLVVNHYKLGIYNYKRLNYDGALTEFYLAIKMYGLLKPLWKIKSILAISYIKFIKIIA